MSDERGAIIVCPACGGSMVETVLEVATVDICRDCRGVWFDWFDGEVSSLARLLDTHPGQPRTLAAPRCPRDDSALEPQAYLGSGPRVWRCQSCLGLYAARDQIAALQAFHHVLPSAGTEPIERTSLLSRLWHAFT